MDPAAVLTCRVSTQSVQGMHMFQIVRLTLADVTYTMFGEPVAGRRTECKHCDMRWLPSDCGLCPTNLA